MPGKKGLETKPPKDQQCLDNQMIELSKSFSFSDFFYFQILKMTNAIHVL